MTLLYRFLMSCKKLTWPLLGLIENVLDIRRYDGEILLTSCMDKDLKKLTKQYEQTNHKIWIFTILISIFGLLILYSATCSAAMTHKGPYYFIIRQAVYMAMGIVIIYFLEHINYQILYSKLAWIIYIVSIAFIPLLKTKLGSGANGATRAIDLKIISFSPSELVKLAVFIVLAYMAQKYRNVSKLRLLVYFWIIGGIPTILVFYFAKDLSSAIVIAGITFGVSFVVTKQWWAHFLGLGVALGSFYAWVRSIMTNIPDVVEITEKSHRVQRIVAWLETEAYYSNVGYQVANTMYACAAGGWFGNGIGSFQNVARYVPYAYTDMIFGVVMYELGICGAIVMFLLFGALLVQMYRTMINAEDIFGSVIALGIMVHIALQVVIHTCVVLNIIPNTGQTLPWISYGGSTILCQSLEIGMLLSIVKLHHLRFAKSELEGNSYIE